LIRIGPGDFTPSASIITFSEQPPGTVNPSFDLATATLGNVTVSFARNFVGQTASGASPVTLSGVPSGPLALSSTGNVFITHDASNPTSPVLSGSPLFNGPISVLFSKPVAAVALDGGFFNAIGGTTLEAFGADGSIRGSAQNTSLGIETFGVADAHGRNSIAGISFSITGFEPCGFEMDNLTFGSARELARDFVPVAESSSYGICGALALLLVTGWRRIQTSVKLPLVP